MNTHGRVLLVLGAVAVAAGCGSGTTVVVPRVSPRPVGSHSASATPTATPNATVTLTPAQVAAALQNVETSYQNLPHASLVTDLQTLATQMVSSGAYRSAVVNPGGISAKLPDGTPVLIFADRGEELGGATASELQRASSARGRLDLPLSAANPHEIAFLVNETDTTGAFTPTRQFAYGNAFTQSGFGASTGYGVDAVSVTLANIASLGIGHPFDFLAMDTHGIIGSDPDNPTLATGIYYAWLSDTPANDAATIAKFQSDIKAGNLVNAIYLTVNKQTVTADQFAFTPTFLTEYTKFNPGAIFDNGSCFGQNPLIAANVQATMQAAGVGRYFGWTKEVDGNDSDETDGFILDRMLGEFDRTASGQSIPTGLAAYANQHMPPQRPFPLDDIDAVIATETRNSPIQTPQSEPYTQSDKHFSINAMAPPIGDGTLARLVISDFGGENVANPTLLYGLPSIAGMYVTESQANGALVIYGSFPAASGGVQITDSSGTYPLAPTAWSPTEITVTLPASGNGSAGLVQVLSTFNAATAVAGNPVPLTQWSGQLVYNETDQIPDLGGDEGSGTGTLQVTYNLTIRDDVHPMVPQIDASAVPQNFTFTEPEGNSSATVTAFNGTFTTVDEGTPPPTMYHATFALAQNAAPMPPAPPTTQGAQNGTFALGAYGGQPSPCNNARAGAQGEPGNVFCPVAAFNSLDTGTCSDDDSGALCGNAILSPSLNFGLPPGVGHVGGQLTLTMDPSTYAITVTSNQATFMSSHFDGQSYDRTATGSMTGAFNAPLNAPTSTTPAIQRPRQSRY